MNIFLHSALDKMDIADISEIAKNKMTFNLPDDALYTIRSMVFKKTGLLDPRVNTAYRKTGRTAFKILLAAVLLASLLAVTAIAAALSGGRFFHTIFGSGGYDIIDDYIMTDLAVTENEQLRLTVESALSDGHFSYIVFSVERLDGGSMSRLTPDMEIKTAYLQQGYSDRGMYFERLETEENTDSLVYYIAYIKTGLDLKTVDLNLYGLKPLSSEDQNERKSYLSVSIPDGYCHMNAGEHMDTDAYANEFIGNISLSPFGLWIDLYRNQNKPADENGMYRSQLEGGTVSYDGLPQRDIFLCYKNGKTVGAAADQFSDMEYMHSIGWTNVTRLPNKNGNSYISIRFDHIADIDKVKSVRIGTTEYMLSYSDPVREESSETDIIDPYESLYHMIFGANAPLQIEDYIAEGINAEGRQFELSLEKIWTDKTTTGIYFRISSRDGSDIGINPILFASELGGLSINAKDKNENELAWSGVNTGYIRCSQSSPDSYLFGIKIQTAAAAEHITVGISDTRSTESEYIRYVPYLTLSIPLDMDKLKEDAYAGFIETPVGMPEA